MRITAAASVLQSEIRSKGLSPRVISDAVQSEMHSLARQNGVTPHSIAVGFVETEEKVKVTIAAEVEDSEFEGTGIHTFVVRDAVRDALIDLADDNGVLMEDLTVEVAPGNEADEPAVRVTDEREPALVGGDVNYDPPRRRSLLHRLLGIGGSR